MSTADIDRLIAERSLERFEFNDGDIAGFWSKALTSFTDAGEPTCLRKEHFSSLTPPDCRQPSRHLQRPACA